MKPTRFPPGLSRPALARHIVLDELRTAGHPLSAGWLAAMVIGRGSRHQYRAPEVRAELERMAADGLVRAVEMPWAIRFRDGRTVARVSVGYELAEGGDGDAT